MRIFQVSALALALAAGPAVAAEAPLQVSYPTDAALDCQGLGAEINKVEVILGIASDDVSKAQGTAKAAELGASAAINGALYSGALGSVPGLGLFGNAAAGFAKNRAAAKEKQAQEQIRTAETRRAMLMGMYAGKNCAAAPAPEPVVQPAADEAPAEPPAEEAPAS